MTGSGAVSASGSSSACAVPGISVPGGPRPRPSGSAGVTSRRGGTALANEAVCGRRIHRGTSRKAQMATMARYRMALLTGQHRVTGPRHVTDGSPAGPGRETREVTSRTVGVGAGRDEYWNRCVAR